MICVGYLDFIAQTERCTGKCIIVPDLVPYCDVNGYIQGMQIRKDHIGKGGKYCWFSTNPEYKDAEGRQIYPMERRRNHGSMRPETSPAVQLILLKVQSKGMWQVIFSMTLCFYVLPEQEVFHSSTSNLSAWAQKDIWVLRYGSTGEWSIRSSQTNGGRGQRDWDPYQNKKWDPTFNGIDNYAQHLFNAA